MAKTALKGMEVNTIASLPVIGKTAPEFTLTANDLSDVSLKDFQGKKIILNIFPSLDTAVCAMSVRKFNSEANNLDNTVVLCISRDLPFAQARFCGAEGLENVQTLSIMKDFRFADDYGVKMIDGPLASLCARSVVIINEEGKVIYTELVSDIVNEPNYEEALKNVK